MLIRKIVLLSSSLFCFSICLAQDLNQIIHIDEVKKIENILASDKMQGRKIFTPEIDSAAAYIATVFKQAGLKTWDGNKNYFQSFQLIKAKVNTADGMVNGQAVDEKNIIAISTKEKLEIDAASGYTVVEMEPGKNLMQTAYALLQAKKDMLVFVPSSYAKDFNRLTRFNRSGFESKHSTVFVLADKKTEDFKFTISQEIKHEGLKNVVGYLPGKTKKNEYVIFSAHYDHLGIGKPNADGDSIYNGANDNAAGTTAIMMLASYFAQLESNERSILFVAFTGEESGGFGSRYFSEQLDPEAVAAMFNIEMIGTESKWGKNSAYITGFEKSDFGMILQRNLAGSEFRFEADPYPAQQLFYRSDNATLAALGVPAHSISTAKMDAEKYYHSTDDEVETLDLENMTAIIKAIAISSQTIISGVDTPTRVEKQDQ